MCIRNFVHLLGVSMTYGNLPYPDLPTLPIYLSENQYQRRRNHPPQPELPLEPQQIRRRHAQPSTSEDENDRPEGNVYEEDKLNHQFPLLRISNLLFSCDDPERTSFFIPLMILLVVHALFLFYLHVYAPASATDQVQQQMKSPYLEYSLNARRYYDVDGLRNKVQ